MKNGTESNASVNKQKTPLEEFKALPLHEQDMFKSDLLMVFDKHESFFMYAKLIRDTAREKGFLKHVSYANDAVKDVHATTLIS